MSTRTAAWRKRCVITAAVLAIVSGMAWAAPREVPVPSDSLPAEGWTIPQQLPTLADMPAAKAPPGWQEFLAYREALRWLGGLLLGLTVFLVLVHLAVYGARHVQPTGRVVKRYSRIEVLLHDLFAVSFVGAWATSTYLILAKHVLGYAENELAVPFGRLTSTLHFISGLLFLGSLVVLAVIWRQGMRFAPYDREWLREFGGYFSREHRILPAGRFNAGQKIWFRASVLLGILASISGILIYYPGVIGLRWGITLYMIHAALSVALSAAVVVHVYLAVLANPRSLRAMVTGDVDEACVREDHPLEPIAGPVEQPR